MSDNSGGGWFFFCLDVVVFFVLFGVPASVFADLPAAFFFVLPPSSSLFGPRTAEVRRDL
jgi:hypothetical protein